MAGPDCFEVGVNGLLAELMQVLDFADIAMEIQACIAFLAPAGFEIHDRVFEILNLCAIGLSQMYRANRARFLQDSDSVTAFDRVMLIRITERHKASLLLFY